MVHLCPHGSYAGYCPICDPRHTGASRSIPATPSCSPDPRDFEIERLCADLETARETNRRLNARCQVYEKALAEKAKANPGLSLGRALANAEATRLAILLEERDKEVALWKNEARCSDEVAKTCEAQMNIARGEATIATTRIKRAKSVIDRAGRTGIMTMESWRAACMIALEELNR